MKLGEMISAWRQKKDVPATEICKELDISKSTLSRIEHGEECDSQTLMRILAWITK